MKLTLSLLMLLTWTLVLHGCGSASAPKVSTRIDGATVSQTDHFSDKAPGATKTTRLTITPTTLPAGTAPVTLKVDGRDVSAPAGSAVTLEQIDTALPAETVHDQEATAAGATIRTDGDASKLGVSSSAPEARINAGTNRGVTGGGSDGGGGNTGGGSTKFDLTAAVAAHFSAASTGELICWGIGLLCLVAALAMIVFEQFMGGLVDWPLVKILAAGGVAFIVLGIVSEKYPWVFLILALGAVGAIAWYVWTWKKAESTPKPTPAPTPAPTGLNVK